MNSRVPTIVAIACCFLQWGGCAKREASRLAVRGDSAAAAGDQALALRSYDQCLRRDPANRRALERTAELYGQMGVFDTAQQRWYAIGDRGYALDTTVARVTRELSEKKVKVGYYLNMASNLQQHEIYEAVPCYCDSVLQLAPLQPQALQLRSLALQNFGKRDSARAAAIRKTAAAGENTRPDTQSVVFGKLIIAPHVIHWLHWTVQATARRSHSLYEFRDNLLRDPTITDRERELITDLFRRNGVPDAPDPYLDLDGRANDILSQTSVLLFSTNHPQDPSAR